MENRQSRVKAILCILAAAFGFSMMTFLVRLSGDVPTMQKAFFTLFRMMTLDDWCSEIAAPILKTHPMSWIYIVSFVLVSAFVVMNVVIGIFVNSMSEEDHQLRGEDAQCNKANIDEMKKQLDRIEKFIREMCPRRN